MSQKIDVPAGNSGELPAEDWLEINQLISEFNFHLGSGNAEAYAALFTVDGSFLREGRAAVVGRKNLVEFIKERSKRPDARTRTQWGSNVVIRPFADGAVAESYQMIVDQVAGGYRIGGVHVKVDELRKENGKWRFHSRRNVSMRGE